MILSGFMRGNWKQMKAPLKGRPRLNLSLIEILEAVRATGNQSQAAACVGCSEAYIRKQLRLAGLTLAQVLAAGDARELLEG